MTELAVTDGMPPPAELPRGECIMTRLEDGSVRIDHADPRILISAELLDCFRGDDHHPDVTYRNIGPEYGHQGSVITLSGVNRTVIYRITDYVPRVNGYIAEWPD